MVNLMSCIVLRRTGSIEVASFGAVSFPLVEKRARVNRLVKESAQVDGAGVPNMMKLVFLTVRLRVRHGHGCRPLTTGMGGLDA